jgi:hypothetical protein
MECLFWAKVMKKLQASSFKPQATSYKLFINSCGYNSGFSGIRSCFI